ncbi:MAG: HlyD family efflux transporter periplasmic adaptor subunit [Candidatus Pacebacteria bacterium]|nr:HlyD family efflux transporter periplasmic adaptor subunit [Candidatus Paceibacterota bacterium]
MKKFLSNIWTSIGKGTSWAVSFSKAHKIVSGFIVLAIIGGGYWAYTSLATSTGGTEYVLSPVTQGSLQVTVTGSGQVAANDQLSLTPQASGQVTEVNVTAGQSVKAGTIVAELDMTDADQSIQTAKENLQSAQISYQQTLNSSQTSLTSDQTSVMTNVTNTYTDLPAVMNGLDTTLHSLSTITGYTAEQNINAYANYVNSIEANNDREQVQQSYQAAVDSYQQTLALYNQSSGQTLTTAQTEQLAQSTLQTATDVDTAVKDALTYYNYINAQVSSARLTTPTQLSSQISSLNSYESTVSGDVTSLTTAENSLESDSQTLANNSSSAPLDVQTAELNVQKAQESLDQAEQNAEDYIVRAPFDGTIASVAVKKYDQASTGTTVATLITTGEYADLSLNETDAAKVKVGQTATMTFDALSGTTMSGTVASVSGVGTVSQGVVTYDVKIGFDTNNADIKPGMTVDATIITASSTNAIQVPSAAVKTASDGSSYVEVATLKNVGTSMGSANARTGRTGSSTPSFGTRPASAAGNDASSSSTTGATTTSPTSRSITVSTDNVAIKKVTVTTGLSNDTMVEITSGLTPGELVVTNTTTGAATTQAPSSGNIFSSLFGGGRRTSTGGGTSSARTSSSATSRTASSFSSNGPSGAAGGGPPSGF